MPYRTAKFDRKAYRRQTRPLFLLGALILVSGLTFYLNPGSLENTSVGRAVTGPIDEIWYGEYILSGLLICYGTQRPAPHIERAGLIFFLTALAVNALAVMAIRGIPSLTVIPAMAVAAWVAWGRYADLTRASKVAKEFDEDAESPS